MVERYGPIFSFQIGWKKFILLSGFQTIKEALGQKAENFTERSSIPLLGIMGHGKNCEGVILASCDNGWREQRRFCVSNLKNLGMGKKTLENSSPFDPHDLIYTAIGNIICSITFGDRFEYHNKNFLKLMHLTEEILKGATKILPQCMTYKSWLSYIPGPQQKFKKDWNDFSTIVKEIVSEHKKTKDSTNPRDLIDAFLEEIEKDTIVVNNLSSVLKDETMWEKPHEFYPEHFLDANGQFAKQEAFLPFSIGRHACVGEPLAKMELFIFFTSLMQHFTFCIPENAPRPTKERVFALTVMPLPFQICAFPR